MIHPVHYSLLLNLAILLVTGALSWLQGNPLYVALGFIVMQHMVGRFEDDQDDDGRGPGDDESQPMGFTAKLN